MVYTAEPDPWCYPGTTVLRNLANLKDQAELDEFEFAMYLSRADEPFPLGALGYEHYLQIHHHLFQDVYEWAGQPRTIRIGKGGNWFCYPEYLNQEMHRVFAPANIDSLFESPNSSIFAGRAANLLADINAGHPFREGNGRTQLAYLKLLAVTAGYNFDDDVLVPATVLNAMIRSFSGDLAPLSHLIADLVR